MVATEGRCKRPESCEGEGGDGDVLDTAAGRRDGDGAEC